MSNLTARQNLSLSAFRLDVDFSVPVVGAVAIFGPSGSGKTTLLRCLAGLERSPSGFIQVGEEVWQDEARNIFVPVHQRAIGFVFQEPRLFSHLSVHGNLTYGQRRREGQRNHMSVEHVINILELEPFLTRRPNQLSGGEQQRVAIGRVLLANPRLLLMDEPLASLDLQRKREILPFIQRLHKELTIPIVYVSHAISEILQLAHTLVLIRNGQVMVAGPIQEVFGNLEQRVYMEQHQIGAVLDVKVSGHEPEFGLTKVELFGQSLYIPHQNLPLDESLRLHVLSRDISLVKGAPPPRTSVLNVLEAKIVEIGELSADRFSVDVKLDVGCPLIASITKKSLAQLDLQPGQRVYAQVKALALSHEFSDA